MAGNAAIDVPRNPIRVTHKAPAPNGRFIFCDTESCSRSQTSSIQHAAQFASGPAGISAAGHPSRGHQTVLACTLIGRLVPYHPLQPDVPGRTLQT